MQTVYEAAGGQEGLLGLARASGLPYPRSGRRGGQPRVQSWFSSRPHRAPGRVLGGGAWGALDVSGAYGDESSVVRMHSGNGPHEEMDLRAIACFDQGLRDVGFSHRHQPSQVLHDYFAWATTSTMSRYHESADDVPDGLRIPRWSWDGLIEPSNTD